MAEFRTLLKKFGCTKRLINFSGHTMKKMERDSYFCDKELMQSLVYDAMVTENLDRHSGSVKEEKQ